MRIWKWLGIAVGAVAGLGVVAVILVLWLVDPNDYKDDIERLAEQQTGRHLSLEGDLHLTVFPWIAIGLGPASLGNAPGFGDAPFLALKEARLGLRFWPLLTGKVELGTIRLDGVTVRLATDAQGRNNWDDLSSRDAPKEAATGQEETSLSASLAGIEIVGGEVSYEDRRDNSRKAVRDFTLTTGAIASGRPFDMATGFLYEQSGVLSARVEMAAKVTADLEAGAHVIEAPAIKATLLGDGFPKDGLPLTLSAGKATLDVGKERYAATGMQFDMVYRGDGLPDAGVQVSVKVASVEADLGAQTMSLAGLDIDAAGGRVTGALTGEQIVDAPQLAGKVMLATLSLRDWLPKLGVEVPVTRDPEVLKRFGLTSDIVLTTRSAEFANLDLVLDDTKVKGMAGVSDFDTHAVRFALDVDRIDADRYLPPDKEEGKTASATDAPVEIPVDTLRDLNARGTLTIGTATLSGIKVGKVRVGLAARDGDVRLNPAEATLYGGQYRGDIGIVARNNTARVTLDQRLANVDFAPLFKDLFDTTRVSGKGSFTSTLSGSGRDSTALLKSLGGSLDFSVNDGALEGTDLWYEIRRARAVLKRQAIPARTGPERTPFTAFKGSAVVKDGIVASNDLEMAMQYLRVAGKATIDLPKSTVDSRVEATVLRIPAEGADPGIDELVNARIPIRITGPLASPKAMPDIEGLIKEQVKEKVKEKIRDTIQDRLRRALGR